MSANTKSSRGLSVILGVLGAMVSFVIASSLLQTVAGGKPEDPTSAERLKKKETVAAEQDALMEKNGLKTSADAVFTKVSDQLKTRQVSTSTVVVPGTPTALKQAAAAPAPVAPVPATPAPVKPAEPVTSPK